MDPRLESVDADLTSQASTIAQQQAQIAELEAQLAAIPPPTSTTDHIYVLDELQALTGTTETTGWVQPSNAGDSGGSSSKPHGTFVVTPGKVATFSAKGGYPYNNGYWYTKRKGAQYDAAHLYLYQLHAQFPDSAALSACNAFELDLQHSLGGKIFNFAWQILHPATDSSLRKWNKLAGAWGATGISVPAATWKPGTMVPITATYRRNPNSLTYLSLTIAGQSLMTKEIEIAPLPSTDSNYLSVGFQLDSNGKTPPTPYSMLVESFRLVYA